MHMDMSGQGASLCRIGPRLAAP
ncbi:protein of unknown function (plasmid) [Cupriavidus taiwanensis]|uniref:Uncharacterized protein n=1 Tax=Cupriavidus taiwanensis TaxID=164546 RepID=A0A7Z7JEI4_9BURK|nr:protein of unknown function [Cupriavidus taiwanensis]SOZ11781.1 protein of unknown function [Cupriavidus taiwanensis]SOZ43136.1 protein of unknown function [Cupriavidus taiwanensis]SPC22382.1 protein of unknown function [Cupriavidus taiwanensis]SPD53889.1 protein of unknown function [Cupriavidus taiwanensis]